MAMCALSAYRIRSGTTFHERVIGEEIHVDQYLDDAMAAASGSPQDPMDFECLQAVGLICLSALESGNTSLLHRYIGIYHAALADQSFHDEQRWPADITTIEREERRRLYWYMYRLEVHLAVVLGHVVRCPELQSAVAYPTLPDQDSTEVTQDSEWLSGWNFITDIYRGMEHLITYFRYRRTKMSQGERALSTTFLTDYNPHEKIVQPLVQALSAMPERFTQAAAISSDIRRNRCVFQVANIICTYQVRIETLHKPIKLYQKKANFESYHSRQLLRLISFAANDGTFYQACRTVLDLIDEISTIPYQVIRAMGLAMVSLA